MHLLTFDNPTSITNKAVFARDNNLHGLMLWDISGDFKVGGPDYDTLSLARAAKKA